MVSDAPAVTSLSTGFPSNYSWSALFCKTCTCLPFPVPLTIYLLFKRRCTHGDVPPQRCSHSTAPTGHCWHRQSAKVSPGKGLHSAFVWENNDLNWYETFRIAEIGVAVVGFQRAVRDQNPEQKKNYPKSIKYHLARTDGLLRYFRVSVSNEQIYRWCKDMCLVHILEQWQYLLLSVLMYFLKDIQTHINLSGVRTLTG